MTIGPVRASRLPVARRCAPREASRLSLDAPPGCFESVSTTDVSLTSTRRQNSFFGDPSSSAVGNPPALDFEIRHDPGHWPSFVGDAGPPRGHPASDGRVLDGTPPASVRGGSRARGRAGRGMSAAAFSAARASPLVPLTPLVSTGDGSAGAPFFNRRSRFHGLHVNASRFREIEAPSAGEVRSEYPRGHPPGAPRPLAGGRG
jgi:hypothetical protein